MKDLKELVQSAPANAVLIFSALLQKVRARYPDEPFLQSIPQGDQGWRVREMEEAANRIVLVMENAQKPMTENEREQPFYNKKMKTTSSGGYVRRLTNAVAHYSPRLHATGLFLPVLSRRGSCLGHTPAGRVQEKAAGSLILPLAENRNKAGAD